VAERGQPKISLFPFMSVLACTIGALMMLLVAMSLAAVGASGIALTEYSASQIKQSTTGNGRAAKAQVQDMIRRLLALDKVPAADAADALAAAICHARVARFDRVVSGQSRRSGSANSRIAGPRGGRPLQSTSPAASRKASPKPPIKTSTQTASRASIKPKGRTRRF